MQNKRQELLSGSIVKTILKISIPVIIANGLQTVYQLIDTFWVGRLGADAVAAVSLSFPILFFLTSLAMGLTMAGSILIAQYNGKGEKDKVSLATGQTFSLVVIIAILIGFVGYIFSSHILSLMTKDAVVLEGATAYLRISFLAIPAMFVYVIFQSALRGVGEVKIPMLIILGSVIINFFIDPLFMFGWRFIPALGVSGVALATLITESLSAVVGILILVRGFDGVKLKLNCLKIRKDWAKKIFALGIPSSLEMSSRSLGMVILTFIVATLGTLTVASYGIGARIISFVIIPSVGFSIATSSLIGNNLGAGKKERAQEIAKTGLKIGFIVLFGVGVILFIFARQIATFLIPSDLEVVALSSNFIRIMALTFGFVGVQVVTVGILKSAGKTVLSMFLAMFHVFSLIVASLILVKVFDLQELGIWIAYPIANVLAMFLALYLYRKKDWLKKKLV